MTMPENQLRVLLVDGHEVVRRKLCALLSERRGINIVGEAGTAQQAVDGALRLHPDVVVMDRRLPDRSGVEACSEIRDQAPDTQVIILTAFADEDALFSAMMAGAAGCVLKNLYSPTLLDAVVTVGHGGSLLEPTMKTTVLGRIRRGQLNHPADDALTMLTPREDRTLDLLGEGLTNREIANELRLAEKTIKNRVSVIYSKLNVQRRSQAATIATERRLRKGAG